jgi:hypothetical protein
MEEHRLGLVIAGVSQRDRLGIALGRDSLEKTVSCPPGTVLAEPGATAQPPGDELDAQVPGEARDGFRVSCRIRSQSMVEVRDNKVQAETVTGAVQRMQQGCGVGATRDRHHDASIAPQHGVFTTRVKELLDNIGPSTPGRSGSVRLRCGSS